jgi:hypothetical protein
MPEGLEYLWRATPREKCFVENIAWILSVYPAWFLLPRNVS